VSLLLLIVLALFTGITGSGSSEASGSGEASEGWSEYPPAESFDGRVFSLQDGEFVTYAPGVAKTGDKIVCIVDGKSIETFVPKPNAGVSTDPMVVTMKANGEVRAECGGIHAETAPPGSW
jgi:hypothetical protein